jgi:NADH:ubiquinone oxidoreductase subunit 4 (subunit M)
MGLVKARARYSIYQCGASVFILTILLILSKKGNSYTIDLVDLIEQNRRTSSANSRIF